MKGLTASDEAHAAVDLALRLEMLADESSFEGAELLANELQPGVDDLRAAMQKYLG